MQWLSSDSHDRTITQNVKGFSMNVKFYNYGGKMFFRFSKLFACLYRLKLIKLRKLDLKSSIWRSTSLSELTPLKIQSELTHLVSDA